MTIPAVSPDQATARVESLSYDSRGVAHLDGKVVFIEDALPGERVRFRYRKQRKRYDTGTLLAVLCASSDRLTPPCPYFGTCGGCRLQHLRPEAQIQAKQQILAEHLKHIGQVQPQGWLTPITGSVWGYRRRARLGVRWLPKQGGLLVGFRERRRSFITPLDACLVLHPWASAILPALRALIAGLSCPNRIPQIEVAMGDNAWALVFRHLVPLCPEDRTLLAKFGHRHGVQIYLQAGARDSTMALWPDSPEPLYYRLPEYEIQIYFRPTDFIQINAEVNRRMIQQVIALLDLAPHERVLDLFCGLGNFTLALARHSRQALGIELDATLVEGARHNAAVNHIPNAVFRQADLYEQRSSAAPWSDFPFDKLLLDPPRSGAMELVKQLPLPGPSRIVYVSCYPATLARDAQYLVQVLGYRLAAAGVLDMFPHTSHVESMALFIRT